MHVVLPVTTMPVLGEPRLTTRRRLGALGRGEDVRRDLDLECEDFTFHLPCLVASRPSGTIHCLAVFQDGPRV